jgi:hypothetical protein
MTQPTSKLNSESRILWSEGSFETTIFASGLRRRRFSVRRPAQAPNGSQPISAPWWVTPVPAALSLPPIVACQGPVIIKLASLHTHQWPTPKGDLLFFTPTLFAQVVLYFASVLPCSPSFPASFQDFPLVDNSLTLAGSTTSTCGRVTWNSLDFWICPCFFHSISLDHRGRCQQFPRRQVSVQTVLCVTIQPLEEARATHSTLPEATT